MSDILQRLNKIIGDLELSVAERKQLLIALISGNWPREMLPSYSTLEHAAVKEVETAAASAGILVTYREAGVQKVVLGLAGPHYGERAQPAWTIPGGFLNLTDTEGSSFVPAIKGQPETPRLAAVREIEEEFRNGDGAPLLEIDPERLKLMDDVVFVPKTGEKRIILGFVLELAEAEITKVKQHITRLADDPEYKAKVSAYTINKDTGKPEIADMAIFDLDDAAMESFNLLHSDQRSLFLRAQRHFALT